MAGPLPEGDDEGEGRGTMKLRGGGRKSLGEGDEEGEGMGGKMKMRGDGR